MPPTFLDGMTLVLTDYNAGTGVSKEGLDHRSVELTGKDVTFWLAIAVTVAKSVLDDPSDEELVDFGTPYVLGLLAGAAAMRTATGGDASARSPGAP
jgi:hypothetical protein